MKLAKRPVSKAEAKAWLDSNVLMYAVHCSVMLLQDSRAAGGVGGSAVVNSEGFLKFKADQGKFLLNN